MKGKINLAHLQLTCLSVRRVIVIVIVIVIVVVVVVVGGCQA